MLWFLQHTTTYTRNNKAHHLVMALLCYGKFKLAQKPPRVVVSFFEIFKEP
jgi:hypothetical protein